ncbi:MAG: NADH-quinone oxidoreductase subunit L [Cyclobacteriaceae bacterium]|nr:NADH-quinone oxidoreductase subunit L [Cyclobacteriaceae bacterium]
MTETSFLSSPFLLALITLCLPLLSACFGFFIKDKVAWFAPLLSSLLMLITFIISLLLIFQGDLNTVRISTVDWFTLNNKIITAGFLLDRTSLSMVGVVALISLLVHVYSIGYMANDKGLVRYFSQLGLFTFAMLGLVMSSNLFLTFCFWELVGFSSYRLIGHWYEKPKAAKAAAKAFIINKVGDLGFLIGLMILWSITDSLEITSLTQLHSPWLTVAGICIFIGIIAKSAQFPFFNWLPDAMEGPTPVSALIHAATMVAAGVFLLIRIEPVFTSDCLVLISIVGALTTVTGAFGALAQFDIKRILAYSTISQLGFMIMAIGSGAADSGFLHLLHHAFFKAGLFLGAGSIIHAMHQAHPSAPDNFDVQDIRNLGGLRKKMPVTFIAFIICAGALAGLPLTTGFLSKELILADMTTWAGTAFSWKWLILSGAWLTVFITPLYAFRLVWFIFFSNPKQENNLVEVPVIMRVPILILALGALTFLFAPSSWQLTSVISKVLPIASNAHGLVFILSLALIMTALLAGFYMFRKKQLSPLQPTFVPHLFLDSINSYFIKFTLYLSNRALMFDKKWIDKFIHGVAYLQVAFAHMVSWSDSRLVDGVVNGISYSTLGFGAITRSVVNGKIQSYLLWSMAGLVIFIVWILY